MTRIILVRHGQTEWNRVVRFRGIIDVPLNDTGLAQARAVGRRLASSPISAVYSSPLSRAYQTAEAIAKPHGLTVVPHEGLRDMNFGDWGGLTPEEAEGMSPDLLPRWYTEPHLIRPPKGGTLGELRERAVPFVQDIVARHPGPSSWWPTRWSIVFCAAISSAWTILTTGGSRRIIAALMCSIIMMVASIS